MKERPIIFNGAMVLAILDGSKTQTRRPVRWDLHYVVSPCGQVGDRLWVRETWARLMADVIQGPKFDHILYRADLRDNNGRQVAVPPRGWRPSIHMPRWLSRITLEVTGVRLQHLQDITEDDAIAEGFASRQAFLDGWAAVYGNANPLVWAAEFKKVEG